LLIRRYEAYSSSSGRGKCEYVGIDDDDLGMICVEGSLSDVAGECSECASGGALMAKLVTRFDFFASFPAEYREISDL
jgi:hypothetical protein